MDSQFEPDLMERQLKDRNIIAIIEDNTCVKIICEDDYIVYIEPQLKLLDKSISTEIKITYHDINKIQLGKL